jgi:fructose-1,6-bisphosphatase II
MRPVLGTIAMNGVVVIGEGEKDNAPMLYNGERVGDGSPPEVDIAVDPVDGITLTPRACPTRSRWLRWPSGAPCSTPGPCVYMERLAVGRDAAGVIDFQAPIEENLRRIAAAKRMEVADLTVCVLDRSRHGEELIGRVRATGARISSCWTGTWPGRSRPPGRAPGWTCWSASAGPRRASSRPAC